MLFDTKHLIKFGAVWKLPIKTRSYLASVSIEKCLTSQQCGDVSFRGKVHLESASEHYKKWEKRLREKTLDLEMKQKAAYSVKNSLPDLINRNKDKYLLRTSNGKFVPRYGIVITDTAKLEKYFNGKIPTDIAQAASTFQTIISTFDSTAGPRNRTPPTIYLSSMRCDFRQ